MLITPDFARTMARYNLWQNRSLIGAADRLDEDARRRDRGAFWGSIARTFSHLLWGDLTWISRFAGGERPAATLAESGDLFADWQGFKALRVATDVHILAWADGLRPGDLEGDLIWYSTVFGHEIARPKALLVVHFFNHQTHHRGQIHAMITAAGGRPDETDLAFMPEVIV